MMDSPVKSSVGRPTSTSAPGAATRYPAASKQYDTRRPASSATTDRAGANCQPSLGSA